MKIFKQSFFTIIICVLIVLSLPSNINASSLETYDISTLKSIEQNMKSDGIDKQRRDILLEKISKGEELESDNPSARPMRVSTSRENGLIVKEETFRDGSYIITKVTDHEKLLEEYYSTYSSGWTPNLGRGRIVSSTSQHTRVEGARAEKSSGRSYVEFYFDYTVVSQGSSSIDDIYNGYGYGYALYDFQYGSPRILREYSNGGTPALAEMDFWFRKQIHEKTTFDTLVVEVNRSGPYVY